MKSSRIQMLLSVAATENMISLTFINSNYTQQSNISQMNTVQSFFPTRAKSKESQIHDKIYHLIRKTSQDLAQPPQQLGVTQNIFRDGQNNLKKYSLDQKLERPVGGADLYKKMENAAKDALNGRDRKVSKRSNKQFTQRNIQTAGPGSRFRKQRLESEERQSQLQVLTNSKKDNRISNGSTIQYKDEIYKEQHQYQPGQSISHGKASFINANFRASDPQSDNIVGRQYKACGEDSLQKNKRQASLNCLNTKVVDGNRLSKLHKETYKSQVVMKQHHENKYMADKKGQSVISSNTLVQHSSNQKKHIHSHTLNSCKLSSGLGRSCNHNQWVSTQHKNYQDKMAILNEINYKKPLVELYGERYFQFMLRDRFHDDFKPPMFIYQIGDKFTDSKVISKLRKYKPNMLERRRLVVKGTLPVHAQPPEEQQQ